MRSHIGQTGIKVMQQHISIVAVILLVALVITATTVAIGCTVSQEPTVTPTPQPTGTPEPPPTRPAPTNTSTPLPTNTPKPAQTSTPEPIETFTPIPSDTPALDPTSTPTPVPADTAVPTHTPAPTNTSTPLSTDTSTPEPTSTHTAVPEPTNTPTPLRTNTATPVPADTAVPTHTPAPTNTSTPLSTDTSTPIPSDTPAPEPTSTNAPIPKHGRCSNGIVVPNIDSDAGLVRDCDTLLQVKHTIEGDGKLNWSESIPITEWHGIQIWDSPLRVKALRLEFSGLSGTMPPELSMLDELEVINFDGNQMIGEIPIELSILSSLTVVSAHANQISGSIPSELGQLANLVELNLRENRLVDEIPPQLMWLSNLRVLNLGANLITGKLPDGLGKLSKLKHLDLSGNNLKGDIPAELANLNALIHLNLSNNKLGDEIPGELSNLTTLEYLDLSNNDLIGNIPHELGKLSNLKSLFLNGNYLLGNIPSEIGNLSNLEHLDLRGNRLSGEIPVELSMLSRLAVMKLAYNMLNGCVSDEIDLADNYDLGPGVRFCSEPPFIETSRPVFNGGIDLGVTYIERLPRYRRIQEVVYFPSSGLCPYPFDENLGPVACPEPPELKRWPDPGEIVELIAHVWNFGDATSSTFDYEWEIDGRTIVKDQHNGLASGESAEFKFSMEWPDAQSNPVITFTLDPQDKIKELIEDNNVVHDWIKGYTLGVHFSPASYESLRLANELGQSIQSPERWLHNNVEFINQLLSDAGTEERIRVELLYIANERYFPPDLMGYLDGWWGLRDDVSIYSLDGYKERPEIDLGLLHEWMHQLGIIDLYLMKVGPHDVKVPNANRRCGGEGCTYQFPSEVQDLMTHIIPRVGTHTAGALTVNSGQPRGYYGEYLFDTPNTTIVKILDKLGNPVSGATLRFYQKEFKEEYLDDAKVADGRAFDPIPEFEVVTDQSGMATLPNRGITGPPTTTGHQLMPNPFGFIDVVGTNGIFLIEMESSECINYEWLTIVEVNFAYWDGQTDEAVFTKTLRCPPP